MNSDWFVAAQRGDTATLIKLREHIYGVDIQGNFGWTALMFAVWGRHLDTARWLLDQGADPNRDSNSHSAITLGVLWARGWHVEAGRCQAKLVPDARFLDLLMTAGGRIGLREAILLGDVRLAEQIINGEGSVDINGESGFGMHDTFLMLAAHVGSVAMVDLILNRGADIEGTDDIGSTALIIASEMGRVDIVCRLLDRGADVNHGWPFFTALSQAKLYNQIETVKVLIERGAK